MKTSPSRRARLRYQFDKSMAAGPIALIGWLAIISLIIIVTAGIFLALTGIAQDGGQPMSFVEGAWESLMRTMDAGTMGGDLGWDFRGVSLFVTIAGIFVFSALIGVLSSGLEEKLSELRKGRSQVLEKDHTIIFNWSPSIFDIISELVIANESRRKPRIVIMARKDKIEMEDEISDKIGKLGNTRIICRSGDPTDLYDINIVNPQTSRSIIVLSPESDSPDSEVIKTVLALVNDPGRRAEPYLVAAEIRDARNADVARIVGGKELQLILADDLISRIVVHSSRQSGLSGVYSELLDFDGCEIYTIEQPGLAGKSFGASVMAYESSTLIGYCDSDDNVHLNPPANRIFLPGERAILIAEDDTTITAGNGEIRVDRSVILAAPARVSVAERTLVLGWNRRGPIIAHELSRYVAAGSQLMIAAETPGLEDEVKGLKLASNNLEVISRVIDTSSRVELDGLDIPGYDHVLVLGYSDHMAPQPADTRTLVTLLQLRKIAEQAGRHISIVSEMTDVRNRELAAVTRADDFVVSNKLVSLMLAQASENPYMAAIFGELLDEDGSEIYMRPITDYVAIDNPVTFYTICLAALRRGEIAIGYRQQADKPDPRNLGGVIVNPNKAQPISFTPEDRLIILARE
ncbi:CASTOR/POLLUX-related putative ion channel [Rhizobium sp. HT1-10]|uniref:CASTOR/POLLUX-related putative ion channel n=1 Tax=Rhizobium sp. HT1-10 TaxID=3111638 RepID=UPI003C1B5C32